MSSGPTKSAGGGGGVPDVHSFIHSLLKITFFVGELEKLNDGFGWYKTVDAEPRKRTDQGAKTNVVYTINMQCPYAKTPRSVIVAT